MAVGYSFSTMHPTSRVPAPACPPAPTCGCRSGAIAPPGSWHDTATARRTGRPIKAGFIATEAKWKAAWAKVNPKEKRPRVDFTRHFLLVSAHDAADPNRRSASASVLKDDKGVVTLGGACTLIGFEPSDRTTYRFYKVSREGVTGVRRFDPARNKSVVVPLPKEVNNSNQ
jgi:hypothetical protein